MSRPHVKAGYEMRDDMTDIINGTRPADYPDAAAAKSTAMDRPKIADAPAAARETRTVTGRTVAASFPPFETLPANHAFSLKRGESLELIAARPDAGRSLLVEDIAKLEQQLCAASLVAAAEGAATYCGVPIIESKFLPPDTAYIVTDSASSASLIAALTSVSAADGEETVTRGELRAIITADPDRLEARVKEAFLQELQPILQRIAEEEVQAFLHGTSAEPPQGLLS